MRNGPGRGRRAPAAFTLVELLFVIAIIFLIMGLLLGGIRHVMKHVKGVGDLAAVNAVKQGVTQFSSTFGFAPPLVKDGVTGFSNPGPPPGPLNPLSGPGAQKPVVYVVGNSADLAFLRFGDPTGAATKSPAFGTRDGRFSLYSLSYYVVGALDVDGVPGPGFRAPKRDGSFESAGRTFNPFFDLKGTAQAVVETMPNFGRVELRDARGVAVRYYRWKTGRAYPAGSNNFEVRVAADMNVPWIVGDPAANPELKNADYAIVAAGPNGLFGDEDLLSAPGPGSPPAVHPQWMSLADMGTKLGLTDTTSAAGIQKLRSAAMADNIVVVGVEANR